MSYHRTREAFAQALLDMAKVDEQIVFVSVDSLKAMRATKFAEIYPEQYIETGIAEQGAVNVGAGLASCGMIPFVGTYAGFLTMRACEQLRTFVAYANLNVKLVGINAGLIGGEREGVTHQFYEDIAIVSAIPNITIFLPADGNQLYHAMFEAAKINGPVYIRSGSGKETDVYAKESPFSIDGVTILQENGNDVLLISSGFVLSEVMQAGKELASLGKKVTVADLNVLWNEPKPALLNLLGKAKCVVTIEDHNVHGGVGSYVSQILCEHAPKYHQRIGLTTFGESGVAEELAEAYGLSCSHIVEVALDTMLKSN